MRSSNLSSRHSCKGTLQVISCPAQLILLLERWYRFLNRVTKPCDAETCVSFRVLPGIDVTASKGLVWCQGTLASCAEAVDSEGGADSCTCSTLIVLKDFVLLFHSAGGIERISSLPNWFTCIKFASLLQAFVIALKLASSLWSLFCRVKRSLRACSLAMEIFATLAMWTDCCCDALMNCPGWNPYSREAFPSAYNSSCSVVRID